MRDIGIYADVGFVEMHSYLGILQPPQECVLFDVTTVITNMETQIVGRILNERREVGSIAATVRSPAIGRQEQVEGHHRS